MCAQACVKDFGYISKMVDYYTRLTSAKENWKPMRHTKFLYAIVGKIYIY